MKFKIDENVSPTAVKVFAAHGFDAMSVQEQGLTGCSDDHLISICTGENRVLVTLDLDFSDIRRYNPALLNGVIILRMERQSRDCISDILAKIMPLLKKEDIKGKLFIVEKDRIRIR